MLYFEANCEDLDEWSLVSDLDLQFANVSFIGEGITGPTVQSYWCLCTSHTLIEIQSTLVILTVYLEYPHISKRKSGPCFNMEI